MIRRITSLLAVVSALCAASCIVTDKIEFEDYVNNPPEVVYVDPSNKEIGFICKTKQYFSVRIWDPDKGDVASYAARLNMYLPSTSDPVKKECGVVGGATTEQLEGYKTGVLIDVTCEIDLQQYQGLEEDTLLLFEVQVSDLGYSGPDPPDGARTAEVVWISKILPDWQC